MRLIDEQHIVHGPEFSLGAGRLRGLRRQQSMRMRLLQGEMPKYETHLFGKRSSSSVGVVAATLQLGHSKSPYSTTVTRACSGPWE